MKSLSDFDLVCRAQKELPYNTSAFEELMVRYEKRIFYLCQNILKDYHLAEDATQKSMIRVFHHIKSFKNESSFFTWFYAIARNESLQLFNKNKNYIASKNVEIVDYASYEDLDLAIDVEALLSRLDEEERELLYHKYTLEFKDEETAAMMRIFDRKERRCRFLMMASSTR